MVEISLEKPLRTKFQVRSQETKGENVSKMLDTNGGETSRTNQLMGSTLQNLDLSRRLISGN